MSKDVYLAKNEADVPHAESLLKLEDPFLEEVYLFAKARNLSLLEKISEYLDGPEGCIRVGRVDISIFSKEIERALKDRSVSNVTRDSLKTLLQISKKALRNGLDIFIDAD